MDTCLQCIYKLQFKQLTTTFKQRHYTHNPKLCTLSLVCVGNTVITMVVIAVSAVHNLNITCLWVASGVWKTFRYIPVHEIALHMGPSKSDALLFFHAFSGCDQVSSFRIGKRKLHGIHGQHMMQWLKISRYWVITPMK